MKELRRQGTRARRSQDTNEPRRQGTKEPGHEGLRDRVARHKTTPWPQGTKAYAQGHQGTKALGQAKAPRNEGLGARARRSQVTMERMCQGTTMPRTRHQCTKAPRLLRATPAQLPHNSRTTPAQHPRMKSLAPEPMAHLGARAPRIQGTRAPRSQGAREPRTQCARALRSHSMNEPRR